MTSPEVHRQYTRNQALVADEMDADPLIQLRTWIDAARAAGMVDPNAMVLATAESVTGSTVAGQVQPTARVVLLRGLDTGLCFYTDCTSRKARALAAFPRAAATFWWDRMERSVRAEGCVERLPRDRAEHYFRGRPRGSQLAALSSHQSQPMGSRAAFETRMAHNAERYAGGAVPCPERWGGYRLIPERIEFWQGRDNRAHDRLVYLRAGNAWRIERLQP